MKIEIRCPLGQLKQPTRRCRSTCTGGSRFAAHMYRHIIDGVPVPIWNLIVMMESNKFAICAECGPNPNKHHIQRKHQHSQQLSTVWCQSKDKSLCPECMIPFPDCRSHVLAVHGETCGRIWARWSSFEPPNEMKSFDRKWLARLQERMYSQRLRSQPLAPPPPPPPPPLPPPLPPPRMQLRPQVQSQTTHKRKGQDTASHITKRPQKRRSMPCRYCNMEFSHLERHMRTCQFRPIDEHAS